MHADCLHARVATLLFFWILLEVLLASQRQEWHAGAHLCRARGLSMLLLGFTVLAYRDMT